MKVAPRDGQIETILDDVGRRARSRAWTKDGGEFIPHPATYLNGHRWEDELEPASGPEPWEREPIYSDADFDATGALKPEAAAREQARIAGCAAGHRDDEAPPTCAPAHTAAGGPMTRRAGVTRTKRAGAPEIPAGD